MKKTISLICILLLFSVPFSAFAATSEDVELMPDLLENANSEVASPEISRNFLNVQLDDLSVSETALILILCMLILVFVMGAFNR